jgi:hypothetical protein
MSELDDDAIHLAPGPDSAAAHFDHDLSDELQDFRFLNSLTLYVDEQVLCEIFGDIFSSSFGSLLIRQILRQCDRKCPRNSAPSWREGLRA